MLSVVNLDSSFCYGLVALGSSVFVAMVELCCVSEYGGVKHATVEGKYFSIDSQKTNPRSAWHSRGGSLT
jgi:hypothetical protein